MSVLRFLLSKDCECAVADSAESIADLPDAGRDWPDNVPFTGGYDGDSAYADLLKDYECIVVSPGISVAQPAIVAARESGVEIVGDVELFARFNQKPVIAVTGSNGKSTVVSLIASVLECAGYKVSLVGNLGRPCLDALDDRTDVVVLELSSFQLETTHSLRPHGSTVLNISADHLDRYRGIEDYASAKLRIFTGARTRFYNQDDALTRPEDDGDGLNVQSYSFTGCDSDWCFDNPDSPRFFCGPNGFSLSTSSLNLPGHHNLSNALVAVGMASTLTDDQKAMSNGLANFKGLPHRMRLVQQINGVSWFNDSKGTNVGASISAIQGLDGPIVLIAGGRGKNADYSTLVEVIERRCKAVVLIGEEASRIAGQLPDNIIVRQADSMSSAVSTAADYASPGDSVLLSPACSSFDMFKNFEERGCVFEQEVLRQCA